MGQAAAAAAELAAAGAASEEPDDVELEPLPAFGPPESPPLLFRRGMVCEQCEPRSLAGVSAWVGAKGLILNYI